MPQQLRVSPSVPPPSVPTPYTFDIVRSTCKAFKRDDPVLHSGVIAWRLFTRPSTTIGCALTIAPQAKCSEVTVLGRVHTS